MRVYQFRHIRAERQSSEGARNRSRPSFVLRTMRHLKRGLTFLAAALALVLGTAAAARPPAPAGSRTVELVVRSQRRRSRSATQSSRALAAATTRHHRLDVRAPASVSYLRTLAAAQRSLEGRIVRAIPRRPRALALRDRRSTGWPSSSRAADASRLATVAGVAEVYPSVTLPLPPRPQPAADRRAGDLGQRPLDRGPGAEDRRHRRGRRPDTSVLRPGRLHDAARLPEGEHGVHDREGDRRARLRPRLDDLEERATPVRPRALGPRHARRRDRGRKLRHRGQPTRSRSRASRRRRTSATTRRSRCRRLDSASTATRPRSPPAIEAAVQDGMDVINLSLGEPEITPSRDLVVACDRRGRGRRRRARGRRRATTTPISGPARSGRPPRRRLRSPSPPSRTAASAPTDVIADFSSGGPTPISLAAQAGGERTRRERALVRPEPRRALGQLQRHEHGLADGRGCGRAAARAPPRLDAGAGEVGARPHRRSGVHRHHEDTRGADHARGRRPDRHPPREHAARLRRADHRLVRPRAPLRTTASRSVTLTDAGGGAGAWTVSVQQQDPEPGVQVTAPATVTVPGQLDLSASVGSSAAESDETGFVVLTRGTDVRRIPYWFRVTAPKLGTEPTTPLARPGRLQRQHDRQALTRLELPLPGRSARREGEDLVQRAGAGLPRPHRRQRRELRRRDPLPGERRLGRAADHGRRRREPARRLHDAAAHLQPLPEHVRRARARVRRGATGRRRLRHRVRHADRRAARSRSRSATGSTTTRRRRCRCWRGASPSRRACRSR